jgi:hypothetical protein
MTKITELPVATSVAEADLFVIVQSGTTKQVATNAPFVSVVGASGNVKIGTETGASPFSLLGASYFSGFASYGPYVRVKHPNDNKYFWITPYQYGMGIEYDGTIEFWANDVSFHNNARSQAGYPVPPRVWVDDNQDLGGIRMSGVINQAGSVQYVEIVSERFTTLSHGDMRFIVRSNTDKFDFRIGASGADASVGTVTSTGLNGFAIGGTTRAAGAFTTLAANSTLTLTGTSPQIVLADAGATSNWIQWAAVGVGAPAFTTRSGGTKLVLYPEISGAKVDEAIGVEAGAMWFSVADSGTNYKWYAATTSIASLTGTGKFTAVSFSANGTDGIDTTITTGSLVGKTITVSKGLITGFA